MIARIETNQALDLGESSAVELVFLAVGAVFTIALLLGFIVLLVRERRKS